MRKKPIGFTNSTPGDETLDVVPVFKLTLQQENINAQAVCLEYQIAETQKKLDAAKEELMILRTHKCEHHVFNDFGGIDYSVRQCAICGADLGLV